MKLIKDYYAELLSLTQLFLLREHSLKDVRMVDPTSMNFFQKKGQPPLSSSAPKKVQPAPISAPEIKNSKISLQSAISEAPQPEARPVEARQESLPAQPLPTFAQPSSVQQTPVIPTSQPPVIQDKISKGKGFSLEPFVSASSQENSEWWNLSQTLFPEWVLSKAIPSDVIAQKNKNAWLKSQEIPPVIILSFHDNEQQQTFLKNIAQAISLRLAPAQVVSASQIEKENGWENILNASQLRLVIAGDYGLYLHPKLMRFYKELPQQGKHFLNQTPLLLLSDLSLYLKEPQLKPLLWRAICNEFAASQSHRRPEK
jgi:hypothetical protein